MHLISWNVHGIPFLRGKRRRLDRIANEIAGRGPDLVLLQEVWTRGDAASIVARLGAVGYSAVGNAPVLIPRNGGLLVLVRDRSEWRARGSRFIRFTASAAIWRVWEADGLGGKGLQTVELEHAATNGTVQVVNTHLQSQYSGRPHAEVRRRQIAQLERLLSQDRATPALVCGDFNSEPDDEALSPLRRAQWTDLTFAARQRCGATDAGRGPHWVDYVWAVPRGRERFDADVDVIRSQSTVDPFSDHWGLDARICIRHE
jgi:endonuclease/exonuclease/phosphatase family metal-dependent hydrolase